LNFCWALPQSGQDTGIGETFASFTFNFPDSHCSIWKLGFKMLGSMLVEPVRRMAMYRRDKAFWVLALKCWVSHWLNLFQRWICLDWRKSFEFSSLVHMRREVGKWVGR
jgi:hypothetical protein